MVSPAIKPGSQGLSFADLVQRFRKIAQEAPDKRRGKNLCYCMADIFLSGFCLFFTQSPSFLEFQRSMQKSKGKNNASTLFGVGDIPSDNHIRDMLDAVPPRYLSPVFSHIFETLDTAGEVEALRTSGGRLLIALDGTNFFSSKNIHCENCSQTKHSDKTTTFSHTAVTPVMVSPGSKRVIPFAPEFVLPQDGHKKQDCENAAAKRWIEGNGHRFEGRNVTLLGDDLYCHQPICTLTLEAGLNFIFVCKPDSHTVLYKLIEELEAMDGVQTIGCKRKERGRFVFDSYRFVNNLPLRGGSDSMDVNWCEIITTDKDGKVLYKNAFATNHQISEQNLVNIVADGRARWKIENENNNTLKNNGYNLEHNFGHGKKFLAMQFATLNVLAFLFHTVLEIVDEKYKLVRDTLVRRKTFFDDIRALTRYHCFDTWDDLLLFMIEGLELEPP